MTAGTVGAGYVGLTTAVCLAERGHRTVCVDTDTARVAQLRRGVATVDEPGLTELLTAGLSDQTLRFSADFGALSDCDVVFVCVPTPSGADGAADLSAVWSAVTELRRVLSPGSVIAVKSTVPVGTTRDIATAVRDKGIHVVSNPEFLRESHAVADAREPDRVLIGATDDTAADRVGALYGATADSVLRMAPESAELAKYASNAFLAVKLSYVNSLAALCAEVGADITDVTRCMGADARIGGQFLQPGPGWGGSCLPKDSAALLYTSRLHGVALREVAASRDTNAAQAPRVVRALSAAMAEPVASARITALGLTFKAGTPDVRDSPALTIAAALAQHGAEVRGYDPQLEVIDPKVLRDNGVTAVDDVYTAAKGADALVVLTEWPVFRDLDWPRIAQHAPDAVVIDTRNVLDPRTVTAAGLRYLGNGRSPGF
ncbi:UDP-glucose/GDP-mannose dehydrogenase family protein [Mycolicibacterium sp. 141076]|uniref:UDP-glucose dehydrogenase family protein n=1 Tax=Mycolicibacterium sp. 141076 TaxID=3090599 RepID=UPI00299E6C7B|nr:UDP-glucose/GDP-mannose dehydrogenase family protein [Mycolicibacterium sp. 141076]MDX1877114.1 UDP-glucose/GDP-mannose dehydrogenase family protein [Mycolicibacterium sp. 141076]